MLFVVEMFAISLISVVTKDPDLVFKMLSGANKSRVLTVGVVKLSEVLAYILLRKGIKNFDIAIIKTKEYLFFITVSIFMLTGIMVLFNQNSINSLKIGISVMFIIYLVIIFTIISIMGILVKNRQAAADKEYISLKNKSLENELYYINELYEKNSKNFHDLNNHLSVISLMIENKQYNEIKKYIDTINDKADTSSQNHKKFNTGNIAVDSVLNLKYSQIEKKNINFDITYHIKIKSYTKQKL